MPDMAGKGRERLLVFEPDPRGHALEWLQHLLRHADARGRPALTLAVAPPLVDALAAWMAAAGIGDAELRPLTPRETALCLHRRLALSGFARWWTMRRHLAASGAARGLFLGIDHLSLPLGCGLRFGGAKISGILFRPSVHYEGGDTPERRAREYLREGRKHLLYRLMLRNPSVERVFSLDPYFPAYADARYGRGDKVRPLADPAMPTHEGSETLVEKSPFPTERVSFVLFGVLSARKGLIALLKALTQIEDGVAARIAVVIAGKIDAELREETAALQAILARDKPRLWLRIDDRHQTEAELQALTQHADIVLAPYQRFVGSSGILIRAAAAGKPVITQNYGLLQKLVRDHRLGLACDTTDPAALAAAIADALRRGPEAIGDAAGRRRFLAHRSPADFAAPLLDTAQAGNAGATAVREASGALAPDMHWSRSRPSRSHRL